MPSEDEFSTANIAVLTLDGTILRVSLDWERYGQVNGQADPCCAVGRNYFAECERAAAAEPNAALALRLLRRVAAGETAGGQFVYPCHGPSERRWFRCEITRLERPPRLLVAHIDVTAEMLRAGRAATG